MLTRTTVGYMVGRFNPLQRGHLALLTHVANENDHMIVLIGSATESRTHKNPLSYEERKSLVLKAFPAAVVLPLPDMPSDEDWVKLFESTITMGIDNLKLSSPVSARLYSADATRADDYALRCSWVSHLSHDVIPFKPVRAATDLSASLVRDNWYHGRYEEIRELVPEDTFDLIQRLDISWMRTPYIKKIETGALGAKNAAFVAFVSDPGYLYRADPACATNELLWNAQVATLGYIVRWNGELGFVGGQVDPGESLQQAALREAKEEIGASLDPAKLELFCSHSMTGKGEPQHTHLFLYRVSMDEMYQLRQQALAAPHSRTELAGFVIAHLVKETPDLLLLQKWAGTAREELQSLIRSGVAVAG